MYKKYIILLSLVYALLSPAAALSAAVSVVDDTGYRVTLPLPAQRVISLAPHITENLYAIGAGDKLVGAAAHSDYPAEARRLPLVGDFTRLNIERIIALQPDLVVAWQDGTSPGQIERLRQLGLQVFVESPDSFEEISRSLRRLGVLTGLEMQAAEVAAQLDARVAALRRRPDTGAPLRVFYLLWHQPLITANATQLIDHVITLCGGENPFAQRPEVAPRVNVEAVIAANPDVILAAVEQHDPHWVQQWQPWRQITAVEHGLLYSIDADLMHRATARAVDGAERVCTLLDQARHQLGGGR